MTNVPERARTCPEPRRAHSAAVCPNLVLGTLSAGVRGTPTTGSVPTTRTGTLAPAAGPVLGGSRVVVGNGASGGSVRDRTPPRPDQARRVAAGLLVAAALAEQDQQQTTTRGGRGVIYDNTPQTERNEEIRAAYAEGESRYSLGKRFGLSDVRLRQILDPDKHNQRMTRMRAGRAERDEIRAHINNQED